MAILPKFLSNLRGTLEPFFGTSGGFEGSEIDTPVSNPDPGKRWLYCKTDGWYEKGSDGVETEFGVGGESGDGGGGVVTDTQANRPAAGNAGTLFVPTDGHYVSIDNGTTWDTYVDGFKCTTPPATLSLTKIGIDTEDTLVASGDGLLLTSAGKNQSSIKASAWVQSVPSAPYTLTVGFDIGFIYPYSSMSLGICLTDVTATNKKIMELSITSQNNAFAQCLLIVQRFSALNTYDNVYTPYFYYQHNRRIFLRIIDNSVSRYFEFSKDGLVWDPLLSQSRTEYFTATHAGIRVQQATTQVPVALNAVRARIFHWSLI